MLVGYEHPELVLETGSRRVIIDFRLINRSETTWRKDDHFALGWQIFDPETGTFIREGEWLRLAADLVPAETAQVRLAVTLPKERGRYHVYVSPILDGAGWMYSTGEEFLLIEAAVESGVARLIEHRITTIRALRRRDLWKRVGKAFSLPVRAIWSNTPLIHSMVRRDILSRYRGSMGDVVWTVLNPLLLMATYFFVFGIVLESRFGPDGSRTGFALYFLAGMLPWLAFSEAVGRAPHVILEYRNFVKKLVFPVEVLPVIQVISGIVTQAFATALFLIVLLVIEGSLPVTVLWLPVLLIPQVLFTMGMAWFLAALGVYLRDLGQIMGFLLTLWFFLTPICYPEASLPPEAAAILTKNPVYILVREYRGILLEERAPALRATAKLLALAVAVFFLGHAWFYKLRKSFADVI